MFMEAVARPAPRCCRCRLPGRRHRTCWPHRGPGPWFRGRPHRRGRRSQPWPDRPARPAPIGGLPRKAAAGEQGLLAHTSLCAVRGEGRCGAPGCARARSRCPWSVGG